MFCLTLSARVYTISLLLRLFVSIHFVPLVCFLPKCLPVSVSLSMFACLFVYLAANLFLSLYLLHKFTVMVSFDLWHNCYFHQSSATVFYFIFLSVYWGRIRYIEFERHGIPRTVCCMGKLFKLSTNYFVIFVLQRATFCFCLFLGYL